MPWWRSSKKKKKKEKEKEKENKANEKEKKKKKTVDFDWSNLQNTILSKSYGHMAYIFFWC